MEILDKLGKKASEAYKMTADKTGKIAKETKLKFKIGELRTQINEIYGQIGKKVYEKHIREEELSIKKDLEEECTKIDVLSDEIEKLLKESLELKNKKQCESCHSQIEKEDKYCPKCGAKQTEEQCKEVEILEDLENSEVKEDNEEEKEFIKENLESNIDDKSEELDENKSEENQKYEENLKKTVEVESNVEKEENDENNN